MCGTGEGTPFYGTLCFVLKWAKDNRRPNKGMLLYQLSYRTFRRGQDSNLRLAKYLLFTAPLFICLYLHSFGKIDRATDGRRL